MSLLVSDIEEVQEREFRRFARQLRLWTHAGAPAPPPLDAWPADTFAPPWTSQTRGSASERRDEQRASRDVLDAVRLLGRGKSRPELVELLTAEYARRGVDVPPTAVVVQAGILQAEQRPFGKVLGGLAALKTMATLTRETVRGFQHAFDGGPEPFEPPDDALFEVPTADPSWVSVPIAVEAERWLADLAADSTWEPRLLTHCEAWLRPAAPTTGSAEVLDVFLGQQRVGQISGSDADAFRPAVAAAARYQEHPLVRAQLLWSTDEAGRALALARPASVPQPPPF